MDGKNESSPKPALPNEKDPVEWSVPAVTKDITRANRRTGLGFLAKLVGVITGGGVVGAAVKTASEQQTPPYEPPAAPTSTPLTSEQITKMAQETHDNYFGKGPAPVGGFVPKPTPTDGEKLVAAQTTGALPKNK